MSIGPKYLMLMHLFCCCFSVTKLCLTLCRPMDLQYVRLHCPSLSPRVCSDSCPLNWWCYLIISSSAARPLFLLSSIFPSIRVFSNESALHVRWPEFGVSALASVLPMNIQGWFPLGLTGLISLRSKGLSTVFSNTTVQKRSFFSAQPSLWSSSHVCTWLLEEP